MNLDGHLIFEAYEDKAKSFADRFIARQNKIKALQGLPSVTRKEFNTAAGVPFKGHGSPVDRGSADAYYGRKFKPNCFVMLNGGTYEKYEKDQMSPEQIESYTNGYYNEKERRSLE